MYYLEMQCVNPAGWQIVFAGLDFNEDEIMLMRRGDDQAIWSRGRLFPVKGVPEIFDTVDRLGDDLFVLVSRTLAAVHSDAVNTFRPNMCILDESGTRIREFFGGTGISHVAVDSARRIWVGYRDEGGLWTSPSGPLPVADDWSDFYRAPGLARFDETGRCSWLLPIDKKVRGRMFHCYALNVGSDGPTVAVDEDNSVLCMGDRGILCRLSTGVPSPRGLARDGRVITLLGRYEPMKRGAPVSGFDVVTTGKVEDDVFKVVSIDKIVMPDGSPLPRAPQGVCSRGRSILFNLGDSSVTYRLRLPGDS